MSTVVWSPYHSAIFAWVDAHAAAPGGLIVEAVAGSGKTTTIVEAAKRIPAQHRAVFLAFNKSIATELGARLPKTVESKTLNSLGNSAVWKSLGKTQLNDKKTLDLVEAWSRSAGSPELSRDEQRFVAGLVAKAKSHALVPAGGKYKGFDATQERWLELADRYDIDLGENFARMLLCADDVLRAGLEQKHIIDFDDQMYFVVAMDLHCTQYDWIIVDEAQDVSHVQRMMLQKFLKRDGRIIAVGDTRQAIYGFRGADSDSMANLAKVFRADRLPLSITYRCAQTIVKQAQTVVKHIEAAPTAPVGVVKNLDSLDVAALTPADMLICRYTAPVIGVAYKMMGRHIACHVQGRDIGAGLVALIKRVGGKYWEQLSLDMFQSKLSDWRQRELDKAAKKDDEAKMDAISDKYESLQAVINGSQLTDLRSIAGEIENMFSGTTGVLLSTVHRAKGLESDRVYILDPGSMPAKRAKQAWQLEQEYNLMYVAFTRARHELYFIDSKSIA